MEMLSGDGVSVPFLGRSPDLRPADRQNRPSKRRFQAGVVQNSAKAHRSPRLLQTYGKLGVFARGKIAELRKKDGDRSGKSSAIGSGSVAE
jgi:hypothetical protein